MKKLLIIFYAFITIPSSLLAQDKIVSGEFETEFFDNYTYDSNNKKNEFNENYLRSRLHLKVNFTDKLSLTSRIRLRESNPTSEATQRSTSPKGGGSKSFEDEVLFLQRLHLNYDYKNGTFVAGKFATKFAQSYQRKDNIWLFEKARARYMQNEKLGFANYLKAGNEKENGHYVLGLATFTNDSKSLDNSTITKESTATKVTGRPGDKRGLKSYIASMDINYDFGAQEKLSYHISYINLAVNENLSPVSKEKIEDANAYAVNMHYQYPLHKHILGKAFIEYVNFSNNEGNIDQDVDFLTTILTFNLFKDYSITIGKYFEQQTTIGGNGIDNEVKEFNLGYSFNDQSILKGIKIMAGVKHEQTDSKTSKVKNNVAGLLVRYIKKF
jgi:hypothetical protein